MSCHPAAFNSSVVGGKIHAVPKVRILSGFSCDPALPKAEEVCGSFDWNDAHGAGSEAPEAEEDFDSFCFEDKPATGSTARAH